jgi:hypothetical protein
MTDPVVQDNTRRVRYEVTNPLGQSLFVITFPVVTLELDSGTLYGIEVYIDDELVDPDDYTVDVDALTVTLDVAAAENSIVVLQGATPPVRLLNYPLRGGLPSSRLNQEAANFFYMIQELLRDRDRALIFAPSAGEGISGLIPAPEAGKALIGNPTANGFTNGPDAGDIAGAQGYAEDALASEAAAAASAVAAAASAVAAAASAVGMKYRAVRAASTANVASLSGTTTIDGVSLIAGDRLLLKNQSTASQNGIYVIAAGAWSRASDMDAWTEVPGTVVVITEGTVNADKVFLCTSNDGGTLGSTAITFIDWAAAIFDGTITNAKLADMAANTIKGSAAGGAPSDIALAPNQFLARSSAGNMAAKAITDTALSILDDATVAAIRATLEIGPWEGGTQATTSGTFFDFSSIPSWVTELEIIIAGLSLSGTDHFLIQIGDSGGLETTSYDSSAELGGAVSTNTTGFVVHNSGAANTHNGIITLSKIGGSTWVSAGICRNSSSTGGTSSGVKTLSGTLDRLRVLATGANTFDAGNVAVRGW